MNRRNLATMYGVGLSPRAPGTAGSFVAAVLAFLLLQLPYGWALIAIGTVLFTVSGTRSTNLYMRIHATHHDPKEVVVDELVGQWLTYLIPLGITYLRAPDLYNEMVHTYAQPLYLLAGFAWFRLFDILKPWPISWADRTIKGGFGVMFDDLLAAIPAGIFYFATSSYLYNITHSD